MSEHWIPPKSTDARIAELRDRHGGKCWLCDRPMNFGAPKESDDCATVEHLIAKKREGPDIWDNLVLCHRRCNQELRDRPLVEKIGLRDERRAKDWNSKTRKQILRLF